MGNEAVRLGVIGCGVIGQTHIAAAAESTSVELVAIADLREDVARSLADTHDVDRVYEQGEALLADDRVQAVVLAMPAHVRTELALKAFDRRLHVLIEKPVAMNASEVEQLIAGRDVAGTVAGCCSCRFRLLPSAGLVTRFISTGTLGDLRVLHCRAIRPGKPPSNTPPPVWRLRKDLNGGGIMSNWGCYDLDYMLGITGWGVRPRQVLARTWSVPGRYSALADPSSDAETHVAATFLCDDNVAIHFERGEMMAVAESLTWNVTGEDGSLDLQMTKERKRIVHHAASSETGLVSEVFWEGDESNDVISYGPVTDFAAAILEGRAPATTLEQALVVQKMTDGLYASAGSENAVDI